MRADGEEPARVSGRVRRKRVIMASVSTIRRFERRCTSSVSRSNRRDGHRDTPSLRTVAHPHASLPVRIRHTGGAGGCGGSLNPPSTPPSLFFWPQAVGVLVFWTPTKTTFNLWPTQLQASCRRVCLEARGTPHRQWSYVRSCTGS